MSYLLALHLLAQQSLATDFAQTLLIKNHRDQHESNPILGPHPSDAKVLAYFAAHAALQEAIYRLAPRNVSILTSIGTIAVEVPMIEKNFKNFKLGLRFGF